MSRSKKKNLGVMSETWTLPDLRKPVDMRAMCESDHVGTYPNVEESAALRLARAIHGAESTRVVISWKAQERAQAFINANGLAASLTEAQRLEDCALPLPSED